MIAVLATAVLFPLLFAVFRTRLKNDYYLMDPQGRPGAFQKHLEGYQGTSKLILTLSVGTIAYLIHLFDSAEAGLFKVAYRDLLSAPLLVFLISCLYGILFILLLNYFYEEYCHCNETPPRSYTRNKYAFVLAFGWSQLLSFLLGYAALAKKFELLPWPF